MSANEECTPDRPRSGPHLWTLSRRENEGRLLDSVDRRTQLAPLIGGGRISHTWRCGHFAMPMRRHIFLKAVVHMPNLRATV